jgi:hypothetical protein
LHGEVCGELDKCCFMIVDRKLGIIVELK